MNFYHEGYPVKTPALDFPYFPLFNSEESELLMKQVKNCDQTPLIVHQLCALQMFQARMHRAK